VTVGLQDVWPYQTVELHGYVWPFDEVDVCVPREGEEKTEVMRKTDAYAVYKDDRHLAHTGT